MNKKGQLGDILEFKIALSILILYFLIVGVYVFVKTIGSEEKISLNEEIPRLQEKLFYQKLLIDYLHKNNLGDLIVQGNVKIIDESSFSPTFPLLIQYPQDKNNLQIYYMLFHSTLETRKLSDTLLPLFNGTSSLTVYLVEEKQ